MFFDRAAVSQQEPRWYRNIMYVQRTVRVYGCPNLVASRVSGYSSMNYKRNKLRVSALSETVMVLSRFSPQQHTLNFSTSTLCTHSLQHRASVLHGTAVIRLSSRWYRPQTKTASPNIVTARVREPLAARIAAIRALHARAPFKNAAEVVQSAAGERWRTSSMEDRGAPTEGALRPCHTARKEAGRQSFAVNMRNKAWLTYSA